MQTRLGDKYSLWAFFFETPQSSDYDARADALVMRGYWRTLRLSAPQPSGKRVPVFTEDQAEMLRIMDLPVPGTVDEAYLGDALDFYGLQAAPEVEALVEARKLAATGKPLKRFTISA